MKCFYPKYFRLKFEDKKSLHEHMVECKAVDSSDSEGSKSKPKSVETAKNDIKDEVKEEEETEKVSTCLVCKETFGDKKSLEVHMTECLGSKDDLLKGWPLVSQIRIMFAF